LIEDELDTLSNDGARLVAHPHTNQDARRPQALTPRVLLAIGPEGGWNPFELTLLSRHRFQPITLGPRILRTDTACIALLALLHESLR
jgi:RsmE family RNA methyltransferase